MNTHELGLESTMEMHLEYLRRMKTPDLLRMVETMRQAQADLATRGEWDRHYGLECLLDYAAFEVETRRDSYTGEFDS